MEEVVQGKDLNWLTSFPRFRDIHFLFGLLWEADPVMLVCTSVIRLVRAALPIAVLWVPKLILDTIVGLAAFHQGSSRLWQLVALEMSLALVADGALRANTLLDTLMADKFTAFVTRKVMDHAAGLDLATLENADFHDRLERIRNRTTGRIYLLTSILNGVQELLTFGTLAYGLWTYSSGLLMLLVFSTVPAFIGEARFSALSYSSYFRRAPHRREQEYIRQLGSTAQSAKEIRLFGLASYLSNRYAELSHAIYVEIKAIASRRAAWSTGLTGVSFLGYYAGYVILIRAVLAGSLTLGGFTFLAGSFVRSRASVERIFFTLNEMSEQAALLSDLIVFLNTTATISQSDAQLLVPQTIKRGFHFHHVSFVYPGSDRIVINDLNFTIEPGQSIALVGENGAGKSTVIKLLLQLYRPTSGCITLDGNDLRLFSPEDLLSHVSGIFQDFMRYDFLARENVGLGQLADLRHDSRLLEASRRSGADRLIKSFRAGLDQQLGKRFTNGVDLSGGEWQKIALARAYMRRAQLFIFDEPASGLDPRSEQYMFDQLREATAGKMSVLVAHKFARVRHVDKILVLDKGTVLEQGTHNELMILNGHYADLFRLQAYDDQT